MQDRLARTIEILQRLVAFPTLSGESNLDFIDYVMAVLNEDGIAAELSHDETGKRANLFATIGPEIDGGIVLNGHSDVVPVEGQAWSSDPFRLRRDGGRLYGRGAVDMKGFLALCLAGLPELKAMPLSKPIHFSICYDEENGGFGAPVLVRQISESTVCPEIAIVGEPTSMRLIAAHKGSIELETKIKGKAGHASDPRLGASAIHSSARFIARLDDLNAVLRERAPEESPFDPPYSTINVGLLNGGSARNIIAAETTFEWEVRLATPDDGPFVLSDMERFVSETLLPDLQTSAPEASIKTEELVTVPPLEYVPGSPAINLVRDLTGLNRDDAASFGTDAGHFTKGGMSTVVFGPGDISEAHKPDEFIAEDALLDGLAFVERLGKKLSV
ncbi:MAG: acetylornithine deacetylase [Pseudomonadota bacterium]